MNIIKDKIAILDNEYIYVFNVIKRINNCKNGFWKATFHVNYLNPYITIKQKIAPSLYVGENIYLDEINYSNENCIISAVTESMHSILDDLEKYHEIRVMEVR